MVNRRILTLLSVLVSLSFGADQIAGADTPKNIVLIYADDIGYGDLSCYGATRVKTPNLDKLAGQGLSFTDAHAAAATCTPSRYALLTGEYSFRQEKAQVLPGDAPALIRPGRFTVASLLKQKGYRTGVVGKWHLGLGVGDLDWNSDIKPGPLEIGFDYAFLIPATGDRVPCVYLENHRVVNLDPNDPIQVNFREPVGNEPTGESNPELLKMHPSAGHNRTIINGISRIGYMSGGQSARWVDEDMADVITDKAREFVDRNKSKPFFLFFSFHDIHVPRVPHQRFVGQTEMGPRGDAIVQLDWCVGAILDNLESNQILEDTLVIFTSDNGPVVDDGYQDEAVEKLGDHRPAGPFRGGKYSNFEGGTRVPFIVSWPRHVKPGESDALIGQVDILASFAALTGQSLGDDAGLDSFNVLPALLGESRTGRDHLVEHAQSLSLRQGQWKLILPNDGPRVNRNTDTELGNDPNPQLYNLADDIGEQNDLAGKFPDKVTEMTTLLEKIQKAGRSRMVPKLD